MAGPGRLLRPGARTGRLPGNRAGAGAFRSANGSVLTEIETNNRLGRSIQGRRSHDGTVTERDFPSLRVRSYFPMSNRSKEQGEFERKKSQDPEKRRQDIERKDPDRSRKEPIREPAEQPRGVKPSIPNQ